MTDGETRGIAPRKITLLLALGAFSLGTGLVVVYGLNVSYALDQGPFSYVRVHPGPLDASWLYRTHLLVVVTPILAIGASPLVLLHAVALSVLMAAALERFPTAGPGVRLLVLVGLAVAFLAPLPGAYSYPHFLSQVIFFHPASLVPLVLFFGDPVIRYGFPALAYALPALALFLARREPVRPLRPGAPRIGPVYLLLSLMFGGMLLILLGDVVHRATGLLLNAALMPAGLLLWALYYRPRLRRLAIPGQATRLERRLSAWRNPAAAFMGTVLVILLLTALEPVESFVEASALGHHGQHLALVAAGLVQGGVVLQQARAFRRRHGLTGELARFVYVSNVLYNRGGWPGVLFAAGVFAVWHTPFFWDLALLNPWVHFAEHVLFVLAGSAVAFSLDRMRAGTQYGLLLGAMAVMSFLSLTLWAAPEPVYATYPREELALLGLVHFFLGMPLMIYLVGRTLAAASRPETQPEEARDRGGRREPASA